MRELRAVDATEEGKVKRVRGLAYSTRVSPQMGARMVDAARGVLNKLLPDVYIHTDHYKGRDAGLSPGFGLTLTAESTSGALFTAQCSASESGVLPEDTGRRAALLLCEEIGNGGCVDSSHQAMFLLFMALCPEDVSRVRVGRLSPYAVSMLRLLRQFFGVVFRIRPAEDTVTPTVLLSCKGSGFRNAARVAT